MERTNSMTVKIKAAVALISIFLILFAINVMYKNHFSELKGFYTSVYEDRLMAEHYLFQLSSLLQEKKKLVDETTELNSSDYHALDDAVAEVLERYELTKLTNTEAMYFASMKENLQALKSMEIYTMYANEAEQEIVRERISETLAEIDLELVTLADIQITEAQGLIRDSDNIVSNSNLTSRLEIGLLIFVGLILQVMISTYQPDRVKFANYRK